MIRFLAGIAASTVLYIVFMALLGVICKGAVTLFMFGYNLGF